MSRKFLQEAIAQAARNRVGPPAFGIASTSQASVNNDSAMTLPLPSGIVAGNLLLMVRRHSVATGSLNPTGWTVAREFLSNGATSVYYRFADGSEGATVSIPLGGIRDTSIICLCITGAHASAPPELPTFTSSADASAVTPSWGSANTLWLPVIGHRNNTQKADSPPSGYSDMIYEESGSGNNSRTAIAVARLLETSASKDPGAWGQTGTLNIPHASIIAIRPA